MLKWEKSHTTKIQKNVKQFSVSHTAKISSTHTQYNNQFAESSKMIIARYRAPLSRYEDLLYLFQ